VRSPRGAPNAITEEHQRDALYKAIAGYELDPDRNSPNAEVEAVLRPRRRSTSLSASERRAVELHAVDVVKRQLEAAGWSVRDVGATHSYDLHCDHVEHGELLVEVKGSTRPLGSIVLTANEVALARAKHPSTALFVVYEIVLSTSGPTPSTSGGAVHEIRPWLPEPGQLEPIAYTYRL
jgi:Domain of unknown function (DUF3883)